MLASEYVNRRKAHFRVLLRQIIFNCQETIQRCILGEEEPGRLLELAESGLLKLGEARAKESLLSAQQILDGEEGGINTFLDPSRRIHGISTGFLKLDEMTGVDNRPVEKKLYEKVKDLFS